MSYFSRITRIRSDRNPPHNPTRSHSYPYLLQKSKPLHVQTRNFIPHQIRDPLFPSIPISFENTLLLSLSLSLTLKLQNPKLSDVTNTLLASLIGLKKNDAVSPDPKGSAPPRPVVASSPSTPRVSSSVSGTSDFGVSEPSSAYGRRQTGQKRKSRGKENEVPYGFPPTRVTRNSGKKTKQDGNNSQFEMDTTPIASTPCPHTTNHEIFEPHSVYSRRQTEPRRKSKGKENIGASSCPPALKIRNTCDNSKEDGENSLSKRSKAPFRKKQRVVSAEKSTSKYTYIDEFLAQKKAYFDDLDKEELAVEEVEP